MENAERNISKLEKKVEKSKKRGKKIQARRTEWEELNDKITGKENIKDTKGTEATKDVVKDGAKEMEGVEQPDLEQPLPIRVAETTDEEPLPVEAEPEEAQPTAVDVGLAVDELDEVT